jgi:hypothetical protein
MGKTAKEVIAGNIRTDVRFFGLKLTTLNFSALVFPHSTFRSPIHHEHCSDGKVKSSGLSTQGSGPASTV